MSLIRLYDEIISVPEGMTYAELLKERGREEKPVLLAREDGKLRELSKKIRDGKSVTFVTIDELPGYETYRRSCSMLFMKAVQNIAGWDSIERIILHFSISSGFFYTIEGNITIDENWIADVESEMRMLVKKDLPFIKKSLPTAEARDIFREDKLKDKERLFRFRLASRTNIYELDGFRDYNYGFMAFSTGALTQFRLFAYGNGIVMQMPRRGAWGEVPPFEPMEKLFRTQIEAEEWAAKIHIEDIGELNERITEGDMFEPILLSEAYHESRIAEIARMISERNGVKFVMIAGPSSSGKTTFSQRLCVQLSAHGMKPHYIGVDNYFLNRENTPVDEFGKKDYESLRAIDVEGFNRDMSDLLAGKTIQIPSFNFQEGHREYTGQTLSLPENDILVIEGIHCLNDELSSSLPRESKFKIYMSALAQLNIDDHDRLPTTDGRLLRRMVRDNRTRGYSAANTIGMWDSVRRGEDRNIFPYQESADVFFNSALPYELAVLKQYAQPLLYQIREDDPEYEEARRLLKFLDYVIGIPSDRVPANSILREFIGGGCFHL